MDTVVSSIEVQRALDEFDDVVSIAQGLEQFYDQLEQQRGIDRSTVASIESLVPNLLTAKLPLNGYTRTLSLTNYTASVETLSETITDIAKRIWAAFVKVMEKLGEWIQSAITWISDTLKGNRKELARARVVEQATHDLLLALPAPYRTFAQKAVEEAIHKADAYFLNFRSLQSLNNALTLSVLHNQKPFTVFKASLNDVPKLVSLADHRLEGIYQTMSNYQYKSVTEDFMVGKTLRTLNGYDEHTFSLLISVTGKTPPDSLSDDNSPGAYFIKARNQVVTYLHDRTIGPGALTVGDVLRLDLEGIAEQCGGITNHLKMLRGKMLAQDSVLPRIKLHTRQLTTVLHEVTRSIREDLDGLQAHLEAEGAFVTLSKHSTQIRNKYWAYMFNAVTTANNNKNSPELERLVNGHISALNQRVKRL
jgi:hypothetical protein